MGRRESVSKIKPTRHWRRRRRRRNWKKKNSSPIHKLISNKHWTIKSVKITRACYRKLRRLHLKLPPIIGKYLNKEISFYEPCRSGSYGSLLPISGTAVPNNSSLSLKAVLIWKLVPRNPSNHHVGIVRIIEWFTVWKPFNLFDLTSPVPMSLRSPLADTTYF